MSYSEYKTLKLSRPEPGILEIVMGEPGRLSVADVQEHREPTEIWREVDADLRDLGDDCLRGRRRAA